MHLSKKLKGIILIKDKVKIQSLIMRLKRPIIMIKYQLNKDIYNSNLYALIIYLKNS